MKNCIIITLVFLIHAGNINGQVPVAEIEGRLRIGIPSNKSTIHIGYESGLNDSLSKGNTFVGHQTGLFNMGGEENSFFGAKAGDDNTTGSYNSFFGYYSGSDNSTGELNSFLGFQAGGGNTKGERNTFIGANTGYQNEKGRYNTFIGAYSGYNNLGKEINTGEGFIYNGSNNLFMGYEAGYSNTTGINNIYVGNKSGRFNVVGGHNIMIGHLAGRKVSGSNNIFLGQGPYIPSAIQDSIINWRLYIGGYDTTLPLIYGEFDNQLLRINGELQTRVNDGQITSFALYEETNNELFGYELEYDGSTDKLHLWSRQFAGNEAQRMTWLKNGNVGIGVDNPNATLHIKDIAKLEPLNEAPACSELLHVGRIYFDAGSDKLRVCTSNVGWVDLH